MSSDNKTVIIDTNIANYILKKDKELQKFNSFLKDKQIAIAFVSVAELTFWKLLEKEISKPDLQKIMLDLDNFINDCIVLYPNMSISQKAATFAYDYEKQRNQKSADGFKI